MPVLLSFLGLVLAVQGVASSTEQCELHIFPTEEVTVATSLGDGLLLGGVLAGRDQPKDIFLRDLPKEAQIAAVKDIQSLAPSLGLPGLAIVAETGSFDLKAAKKTKVRLTAATAPCYAELIFTNIVYSSNALNGRHIGSLTVLRRFDAGQLISVRVMGGAGKLSLYPSKRAEDRDPALRELRNAFRISVEESIRRFARK